MKHKHLPHYIPMASIVSSVRAKALLSLLQLAPRYGQGGETDLIQRIDSDVANINAISKCVYPSG